MTKRIIKISDLGKHTKQESCTENINKIGRTWQLWPGDVQQHLDLLPIDRLYRAHPKWLHHRGRQSSKQKSSLNIWLFSCYFSTRSFCRYHSKFSCWKLLPGNRGNKDKSSQMSLFSDVFSFPVRFEFFETFFYCLHFVCEVCLHVKETAGTRQTYGQIQVWFGEMERKLAKLSKTYYLPFFLLIIFWIAPLLIGNNRRGRQSGM